MNREELVLTTNPEFLHFVRATRTTFRVAEPLLVDKGIGTTAFADMFSGEIGFLSIRSPEARIECCSNGKKAALIWDWRFLEYLFAFTNLMFPLTTDDNVEVIRFAREEPARNLFLLFIMEQLSLYGDKHLAAALEIKRILTTNDMCTNTILRCAFQQQLSTSPLHKYVDFVKECLLYLVLFHECAHLEERSSSSSRLHDFDVGTMLQPSLVEWTLERENEFKKMLRSRPLYERLLAIFSKEKRSFRSETRRVWAQAHSLTTKEELFCDFGAVSLVFWAVVWPPFEDTGDVAYLYLGEWTVEIYIKWLSYSGALARMAFVFDKIDGSDKNYRGQIAIPEPEGRARIEMLKFAYLSAMRVKSMLEKKLNKEELHKMFDYVRGRAKYLSKIANVIDSNFGMMLKRMWDDKYWHEILERGARDGACGSATREAVAIFLGWHD